MWGFKKRRFVTFADYAKSRPVAPCNEQEEHILWTEIEGLPCPHCARIEKEQAQKKTEDAFAEKIAIAVYAKISGDSQTQDLQKFKQACLSLVKHSCNQRGLRCILDQVESGTPITCETCPLRTYCPFADT